MKLRIFLALFLSCFTLLANAFEILAFGTSATNCKGIGRDQIFPVKLQELLRADGMDVTVINGGVDGDKPIWMVNRIKTLIKPETKIVLFEPGPNERNKAYSLGPTEDIMAYLQSLQMPTVYMSNSVVQTNEEAAEFANKYGAYYFGSWKQDVPRDREHFQYDYPVGDGHMTAQGCLQWAKNMVPMIKKVVAEKRIN